MYAMFIFVMNNHDRNAFVSKNRHEVNHVVLCCHDAQYVFILDG